MFQAIDQVISIFVVTFLIVALLGIWAVLSGLAILIYRLIRMR